MKELGTNVWSGIKRHGWKVGVGALAIGGLLYLCLKGKDGDECDDPIETEFDDALDPIGDLPGEDG